MAEALFRNKVAKEGLTEWITVDSAGTGAWHIGETPHQGTQLILKALNIPFNGIKARQLEPDDMSRYDWILVMDQENQDAVKRLSPDAHNVFKVLEFADVFDQNVPDPFYTGGFEEVYRLLDQALDNFLQVLTDGQN